MIRGSHTICSNVYVCVTELVIVVVTVPVNVTVGVVVQPSIEEQNEEAGFVLVKLKPIAFTQLETLATAVHDGFTA